MSGFANSVVNAAGTLLRRAIASPNYVANTTGWSINKDGTADFATATIRGTIIIGSATGAHVFVGTVGGVPGVYIYDTDGTTLLAAFLTISAAQSMIQFAGGTKFGGGAETAGYVLCNPRQVGGVHQSAVRLQAPYDPAAPGVQSTIELDGASFTDAGVAVAGAIAISAPNIQTSGPLETLGLINVENGIKVNAGALGTPATTSARDWGVVTVTSSVAGVITIPHNLGRIPTRMQITAKGSVGGAVVVINHGALNLANVTGTVFNLAGATVNSTSGTYFWEVEA